MHNKITMIMMIRILLLCCIIPRHALSQTVSWTVGTSVPRFKDDLKLDCTVSSDCCTNFDRIWANGTGSQFINSGNSASNKYVEDWNTSVTTGFSLIIKNLQDSDVEVEYDCQYRIGNDKHTLTQDATWEYPPDATEGCPKATSDKRLIGTLHISKAAPYPYVSASFMGENVTTGLTVTGLTNFNTWFYRFTVSINTECSNDGRLIVTVVTGTKATTVCDKEIICKPICVNCGLIHFLWSFIGTVVGSSIMMAGILIIILEDFEDGEDDIVDRILTDDDSSEDFSYNRVLFLFLKVVRTFDEVKRIKKLLGDALKTFFASLAVCGVITLTSGYMSCACFDYADGSYDIVSGVGFIALGYILVIVMLLFLSYNKEYKELKCVLFLVALLLCAYITLFGYAVYISIKKKKRSKVIVCILILVICTQGLILVPLAGFIVYKAVTGSRTLLKSPFKATTDKKIRWFKVQNNEPKLYSEGKDINPNLQPEISSRLKVTGDHNTGEYHLNISNISTSDEGIYQCSLFGTENTDSVDFRQHLTVKSGKKTPTPV